MKRPLSIAAVVILLALGLTSCATITICKTTVPPGGTGFPFTWANPAGPLPSFGLNDGQCSTKNVTTQDHSNTFTENVPIGWMLANITCAFTTSVVNLVGATPNPHPVFQPGDTTVVMDVNEANVTCTFVNQFNPACVCNSKFDVSTGQGGPTDPLWTFNGQHAAYTTSALAAWSTFPPAAWIQPVASSTPGIVAHGVYRYQVRLNVPECPRGQVELNGSFAADNSAVALLNGVPIPGASCPGLNCFSTTAGQAPVSLSVTVPPGANLLEIVVTNGAPPFFGASQSGLVVNAGLTRTCR